MVKNKLYVSGDEDKYKYYRNKICSLIRLSKKIYYQDYFERHKTNMKKTWEGINDVLHRRKKTKIITAIKDPNKSNKIVKEPSQVANILNDHFSSVGNRLASTIPTPQQHYLNYVSHCKAPSSSFLFLPVTSDEVKFQILSIPNNKSYGLYSSPIKLLKCASSIIAPILSEILNISVTLGKYPSKLKLSKITPIFKSGEDNDANNYRPISLLSNFNRIFEKIMYNRMKDYIDKHNLLYSSQYGFRKGHSTQHAILDIVNAIQTNCDESRSFLVWSLHRPQESF